MIVSSAPGRCGIIGNPTDMYGGSVIACSTAERAHCTLTDSDVLSITANGLAEEFRPGDEPRLAGNRLDIAKAVLIYHGLTPANFKQHISISSDVPECAGLAGSTAVVVAVLGAVLKKLGLEMERHVIAETARKIEFEVMGVTCGFQDQHMATFGGLHYMDFRDKERMAQDEREPFATVESLAHAVDDVPIVVADTGITRNSGVVHKSIRDRWLKGEAEVVEGYKRIAQLARLGKKALILKQWNVLGQLMNENHEIQRALGGSGPQNDHLIEVARQNGALGAKLAGAGHGGTILALTLEPDRTVKALRSAGAHRMLWPKPMPGLTVSVSSQNQLSETVTA